MDIPHRVSKSPELHVHVKVSYFWENVLLAFKKGIFGGF